MKRIQWFLISLFLFVPFIVKAETLTYDVCESGCEYSSFGDVETALNNISDLSDKDIVININSDMNGSLYIGDIDKQPKSLTVNGNDHTILWAYIYATNIELNRLMILTRADIVNSKKINIIKSSARMVHISFIEGNQLSTSEIELSNILEIDEELLNSINLFGFSGNVKIENMSFKNNGLIQLGGTLNIHNSEICKVIYIPESDVGKTNIYNSKFITLKYKNITTSEELEEFDDFYGTGDISTLNYDIYDINIEGLYSNTTVYFDKEATIKVGNKLDLSSYLDYYTNDKEIEYTIEDESIAKIENKELTALKEGSTKVTVTTDEGHVVYRINLVVEKESLPEKIDKMTIKVPITGSKIKTWVVVVSVVLLAVTLVCTSILIKRKK